MAGKRKVLTGSVMVVRLYSCTGSVAMVLKVNRAGQRPYLAHFRGKGCADTAQLALETLQVLLTIPAHPSLQSKN